MLGIVVLTALMLLSLPAILRGALAVANRLRTSVMSVVPVIAIGEVESSGGRSVGLVALAAIAVFGSTAVGAAQRDLQHGLDRMAVELSGDGDAWITAAGAANALATTSFPPTAISRIAGRPEVARVRLYRGSFLDIGDRRAWVIAPPAEPFFTGRGGEGEFRRAVRAVSRPHAAVVSEAIAHDMGVKVVGHLHARVPSSHPFPAHGHHVQSWLDARGDRRQR